jgi:DNA anti-recombination protein RmuC
MAQLDAQLRERKRSFSRRIDAVDRIQAAASGLEERIAEIEEGQQALDSLSEQLESLTLSLRSFSEPLSDDSSASTPLPLPVQA